MVNEKLVRAKQFSSSSSAFSLAVLCSFLPNKKGGGGLCFVTILKSTGQGLFYLESEVYLSFWTLTVCSAFIKNFKYLTRSLLIIRFHIRQISQKFQIIQSMLRDIQFRGFHIFRMILVKNFAAHFLYVIMFFWRFCQSL